MTPTDEDEILRKFLAGDVPVTRRVERWAREIIHFKDYGIPAGFHEDIVQETVTQVWRAASREEFVLRLTLRALVRRVAMARCVDHLRRSRPTVELTELTADTAPGPYDAVLESDERARVRWALQNLDDPCREVIQLHFFDELPYADIASRLDRAEATIRVRMFNCMKAIRKLLAPAQQLGRGSRRDV